MRSVSHVASPNRHRQQNYGNVPGTLSGPENIETKLVHEPKGQLLVPGALQTHEREWLRERERERETMSPATRLIRIRSTKDVMFALIVKLRGGKQSGNGCHRL